MMTYQQFDEVLQRQFEMTPQREQKLRARWAAMSARGPWFFAVTRGSLLFLWMVVCFVFFAWRMHTLQVLEEGWVTGVEAGCMLFFSLLAPLSGYFVTRNMVRSLDRRPRRALRQELG